MKCITPVKLPDLGSTCLGNPFGACTYRDPEKQRPLPDENGWRVEEHEVLVAAFDQYLEALGVG